METLGLGTKLLSLDYLVGDKGHTHVQGHQGPGSSPTMVMIIVWGGFLALFFLLHLLLCEALFCARNSGNPLGCTAHTRRLNNSVI